MTLREWSHNEVEYGKKILGSGVDGARSGRTEFLHGSAVTPFLTESVCTSWRYAALGACVGILTAKRSKRKSLDQIFVYAFLGGIAGFGVGIAWRSRRLTGSMAGAAMHNINKVRDEHWLETHPIDYA